LNVGCTQTMPPGICMHVIVVPLKFGQHSRCGHALGTFPLALGLRSGTRVYRAPDVLSGSHAVKQPEKRTR